MNKNNRLKIEFNNDIYDVVNEAIKATIKKYGYHKYDIAKLVLALYQDKYDYIVHDDEYRDQIQLLDDYFKSGFNHRLITFIMLKKILSYKDNDKYDEIVLDISSIESLVRTGVSATKDNLEDFYKLLKEEKYEEALNQIENKQSLKFAMAVIYDKLLNEEN